ncbi:MAG: TIGR01841 family phasin [Pseudomonadota bacterium]
MAPVSRQFPKNEKLADIASAGFDGRLALVSQLSTNAIESIQQIVDLNLNAAKASAEGSAVAASRLLAAKNPQEFISRAVAQAKPATAEAIVYNLHLAAIAAATQAEIARVAEEHIAEFSPAKSSQEFMLQTAAQAQPAAVSATAYNLHLAAIAAATQAEIARDAEEKIIETDREVSALVDEVSKSAPAGSQDVMAVMKCAVDSASAGYEHFSKTSRQAIEVMEKNWNTAANRFSQVAERSGTA